MNIDQMTADHPTHAEPPGRTPTPEAVEDAEVSELARHADPSQATKTVAAAKRKPGRGVEWVRPSDLMTRAGSHVAGRGIDFQAELARRARGLTADGARAAGRGARNAGRALSERARRLPPASAFGRGPGPNHFSWVSRSGIGLG
ncbi:MAG: hypothetical protein BGN97_10065 [Microbacterium sp. 69-10]|uniref:hypothetical protein n=1 Tax=Microbacterium sp. 69-10 TaxID=1895783 RepID=UPI0009616DC5|nr:hypothetical protein [Microbacterium sp. 69-10]OJU41507.1 MAG: hypothetical protein BGN97_10065 [Microbacterium sp. 69-10]